MATTIASKTVNATAIASKAIADTSDKIKASIEEKKQIEIKQRENDKNFAIYKIENPIIVEFINSLDNTKLNFQNIM